MIFFYLAVLSLCAKDTTMLCTEEEEEDIYIYNIQIYLGVYKCIYPMIEIYPM